jgi:hypothetical protein
MVHLAIKLWFPMAMLNSQMVLEDLKVFWNYTKADGFSIASELIRAVCVEAGYPSGCSFRFSRAKASNWRCVWRPWLRPGLIKAAFVKPKDMSKYCVIVGMVLRHKYYNWWYCWDTILIVISCDNILLSCNIIIIKWYWMILHDLIIVYQGLPLNIIFKDVFPYSK